MGGLLLLVWGCTGPNPAYERALPLDASNGRGGTGGGAGLEAGQETGPGGSTGGATEAGAPGDGAPDDTPPAGTDGPDAPIDSVVLPPDLAPDLPLDLPPDLAPDLPPDLAPDLPPDAPVPVGTGLLGHYYDGNGLEGGNTGDLVMTRNGEAIDFDWGTGRVRSDIDDNYFSVRWTGKVMPLFSGTYTFRTVTDDGVRLWVRGQPIIDRWMATSGPVTSNGTIVLEAYTQYEIRMEYREDEGAAEVHLYWMSGSQQPLQIIPRANLFLPTP